MSPKLRIPLLVLVTFLVVVGAFAQTRVLTRKDGRKFIGEVTRKNGAYEVTTDMGTISIPEADVSSVEDYVDPREEYERRLLAVDPGDPAEVFRFAKWCYDNKLYDEAREQLQVVLELQRDHESATLLLSLVEAELAKSDSAGRPRRRPARAIPEDVLGQLVAQEDVEQIRLAELRRSDRVAIRFENDVLRRFLDRIRGTGKFAEEDSDKRFLRQNPVDQAVDILVNKDNLGGAADLLRDINIQTNPAFMAAFKTRIWPLVSRNCATAACHGGVEGAGGLKLYNLPTQDDRVFYTNFLILDAFETRQGRLIDRARPAQSLILQYGLPREQATADHPTPLPPMFRNDQDPRFRAVDAWIRSLLYPHPSYAGVEYLNRIPGGDGRGPLFDSSGQIPTTQPSEETSPGEDAGAGGPQFGS